MQSVFSKDGATILDYINVTLFDGASVFVAFVIDVKLIDSSTVIINKVNVQFFSIRRNHNQTLRIYGDEAFKKTEEYAMIYPELSSSIGDMLSSSLDHAQAAIG